MKVNRNYLTTILLLAIAFVLIGLAGNYIRTVQEQYQQNLSEYIESNIMPGENWDD